MIPFLLRRLLLLLPTLWGVGTLVFLLIHLVPGDPVDILLGEMALPAQRESLRAQLHLDQPLAKQYAIFWSGVIRGDLGQSLLSRQPVAKLIAERYPATVSLALAASGVACLIAFPLGMAAAVRRGSFWDRAAMFFSVAGISVPTFWLGPIFMLLFSVWMGWFPVSGRDGWESYILPAFTLGFGMSGVLTRMVRSGLVEVLQKDFIVTAHSKGLKPATVFWKHALKNAMIPVITVLGLQLGGLLAGAVITETIFDWPGLGELLYRSIQSRDYPGVQGCVLVIAATFVGANTLSDIAYRWANPKLSLE